MKFVKPGVAVVLMTFMLIACTSLALVAPKSFDQRTAYAYGTVTALRQAATTALNEYTITSDEAEYVLRVTDESRMVLDTAKSLRGSGDLEGAEARVELATNILLQLKAYLASKGE